MTGTDFRPYLYAKDHPRVAELHGLDAYQYRDHARHDAFTGELIRGWTPLYFAPFTGVTNNGERQENLYALQSAEPGEAAPTAAMVAAADALLASLPIVKRERLCHPVDAPEWQGWANPEFLQHDIGLRLEFEDEPTRAAFFVLLEASLSPTGYRLTRQLMEINAYLGSLLDLEGVMNEFSYNVAVYGEPSLAEPWGWQFFGHHLAVNCLVVGEQMVMTPVFFGAEPAILSGEDAHAGDEAGVFGRRIALARELMQSLSDEQRSSAQTYENMVDAAMPPGRVHPGDERHLAGAFQDNRVIPYEGIRVAEMDERGRHLVMDIFAEFTAYLPEGPAAARRREIGAHLAETWFSWIGGTGPDDPFYFRLQSPVVVLELDHHSGVFLTNDEPAPFHIHTVMRTPNGNDYGRQLVRHALERAGERAGEEVLS